MLMTETGLLCDPACPKLQAWAIGRYYSRALSYNLLGSMWYIYDSDEFHNTALVNPQDPSQPRLAYQAYRHAAAMLKDATSAGALEGQPSGIEGYRFTRADGTLTVFWSSKPQAVGIPVDLNATVTCTTWDGTALPCANITGSVALAADLAPIYVVAH
jgi:hypothetical protein